MYHPAFFEMVSDSIVAEHRARAERQRMTDVLDDGLSTGWTTRANRFHVLLRLRLRAFTARPADRVPWSTRPDTVPQPLAHGEVEPGQVL